MTSAPHQDGEVAFVVVDVDERRQHFAGFLVFHTPANNKLYF